jgi:hypothetical protein
MGYSALVSRLLAAYTGVGRLPCKLELGCLSIIKFAENAGNS